MSRPKSTWTVAEAKARFSELIDRVLTSSPQTITRKGIPAVVVVSVQEWNRKVHRKGNLAQFFANSLLLGSTLEVERLGELPKGISLG